MTPPHPPPAGPAEADRLVAQLEAARPDAAMIDAAEAAIVAAPWAASHAEAAQKLVARLSRLRHGGAAPKAG